MTDPEALDLAPARLDSRIIEQVLLAGDLSGLTEAQRLAYYRKTCESLGLNPLTKPFEYLKLNGKLVLYARKDATEQLRKIHGVSIEKIETKEIRDVFIVTATARDKAGRIDASTGAVTISNLRGDALANAIMKAETKSKRRVTLSICGLGMLDETELETIPDARPAQISVTANVDPATGEVLADAEAGELAADEFLILDVDSSKRGEKNGKPWILYQIRTTSDHVFTTFSHSLAEKCAIAKQDQRPVKLIAQEKKLASGQVTRELVSVHALRLPGEDANDLPF